MSETAENSTLPTLLAVIGIAVGIVVLAVALFQTSLDHPLNLVPQSLGDVEEREVELTSEAADAGQ